jgi:hypothetical protein
VLFQITVAPIDREVLLQREAALAFRFIVKRIARSSVSAIVAPRASWREIF